MQIIKKLSQLVFFTTWFLMITSRAMIAGTKLAQNERLYRNYCGQD